MSDFTTYNVNLDAITRYSGRGNRACSIHNILKNKNWLGGPPQIQPVTEGSGLIFVTKPDMCLLPANIGHIREMSPLLTNDPYSLGSTFRDMLDPRSAWFNRNSRLNDPLYPFLGIIDNTAITVDGWPDYVMEEYVSTPGRAGSTYILAKGRIKKGQKFDLAFQHRNLPGDAINQFYTYNALYQDFVHHWNVGPHNKNVRYNRLDYTMRVYRFVFDSTGRRLNQFTMCGYGFPTSGSQGAVMAYNSEEGINSGYDVVSGNWPCVGVFHNDPIVIRCFNQLVVNFNPAMADNVREKTYIRVGSDQKSSSLTNIGPYQYYGYPRINPRTLEFEVWVDKALYNHISQSGIGEETIHNIEKDRDLNMLNALRNRGPQYVKEIFK